RGVGDVVFAEQVARAVGGRGPHQVGLVPYPPLFRSRGAEGDLARALVGGQEAAVGGAEGRVGRAVDLAVGDRAHRGRLAVDREVGRVVGDVVVAEQVARAVGGRGRDQVGTAGDRLARGATGAQGDLTPAVFACDQAGVGGAEARVGRAVDLAVGDRADRGRLAVDR